MAEEITEELTPEELEAKKQEIRDNQYGNKEKEDEEDIKLPSDGEEEPRVYANNFKSVEELKKGIDNLGSSLPEYVLNGMSDDALEQHYIELRKEFSSRGQKKDEEQPKTSNDKPSEKVSDDLWNEIKATYAETGDISAEQRAELKKQGFSDAFIDSQKQGYDAQRKLQEVELQSFTDKLYTLSGGKEGYEEIKAWAEENIPAHELKAISDMGERNDYSGMLYAMKGIKADYLAANGNTQNRVHGSSNSGKQGYNSQQDYLLDRMSPEYKSNSRYRAKVDEKFRNSSFAS